LHNLVVSSCVGEDAFDEGKTFSHAAQQIARAVAVLNVGGQNAHAEQKAERVNEDMALAARDFLARIEALWVDRRAPFWAALLLWLSNRRRRARFASRRLAQRPIERLVDALQRAVPIPPHK
jgi:hypothetical protein